MGHNHQEEATPNHEVLERVLNADKDCPHWGRPCSEVRGHCRKWIRLHEMTIHTQLQIPRMQTVETCMDDQVLVILQNMANMLSQGARAQMAQVQQQAQQRFAPPNGPTG